MRGRGSYRERKMKSREVKAEACKGAEEVDSGKRGGEGFSGK